MIRDYRRPVGSSRTPWKKSRTLGDIYGGRQRRAVTDGIFNRLHSLDPPTPGDVLPIVMEDNPSRDFIFPSSSAAMVERIRSLTSERQEITHLWLRRVNHRASRTAPLAEFVCGSGVRLIVVYPWPADLLQRLGPTKPAKAILHSFAPWTTDLRKVDGEWCLKWGADALERYCLDHLIAHEVGHHLDQYAHGWTPANRRQTEARADSYAAMWTASQAGAITT